MTHKYHEYGWLIEGAWSHVQTPDYWIGSSAWSTDHERALRFARKQDAEQAAAMMLDGVRVRICEHAWTIDRTDTKRGKRSRPANPDTQDLPSAADSAEGCGLSDNENRYSEMTAHRLNDAPVLDQMEGNYMKFLAFVVWKLAPKGVTITLADIEKFAAEGGNLLVHGHYDSFEFRIVSPEDAARLAAHEQTSNRGRA